MEDADLGTWFRDRGLLLVNLASSFLAVAAIVGSVYLRQRTSPGSNPVATPHAKTGT